MKPIWAAVLVAGFIGLAAGFGLKALMTDRPALVLSGSGGSSASRASAPSSSEGPAQPVSQIPTAADSGFGFVRSIVNNAGDSPEACFRFNRPLDDRPEAHYQDYLRITPVVTPALRVDRSDLCLAGLAYGTTYAVTFLGGLPAQSGEKLAHDVKIEAGLSDRPPLVAISGSGFILPRDTSHGLTIQTVNVEHVKIHVLRMSDRLLPQKISGNRYGASVNLTIDKMNRWDIRNLLQNAANLVWSGVMDITPDHNRTVETAFPLAGIVKPGQTGAYIVIAEDAASATPEHVFTKPDGNNGGEDGNELWTSVPAHWVISTDIALTALTGDDGLHLFARSLATAKPIDGLNLRMLSTGEDVLAEGETDSDGRLDVAPGLIHGLGAKAPSSIVAYGRGGDFAILYLNRPAFDLSDRGVSGRAQPGPLDAYLYTERGIYRPGETVQVTALLRDRRGYGEGDLPTTLVVRRPDGVEAKRFAIPPQAEGGIHQAVVLTASAARGMWTVELFADPSGDPVGRVQFDVEDFVPQKLKVELKPAQAVLIPGQPINLAVTGRFLYGAPAAGLKGEAELRMTPDPHPVAGADGYSFGLIGEHTEDTVQTLEMPDADAQGQSLITASLDAPPPGSRPLKAEISAGFFEPGGRLVNDEVSMPIHNQQILIGIKEDFAEARVDEEKPADFGLRVFDGDGYPIARPGLHWTLVREERVFDWFNADGGWSWHYHVVDQPVQSGGIDVAAGAPAKLTQKVDWGDYRLIVEDPATHAASSVRFTSGWGETTASDETPDKVEVTAEHASLAIGDTTKLKIRGPFAGEAQISIAGDRLFQTRSISIPKEGATIEVEGSADWGAGAYVLVSMIRPLTEGRPHDPVRAVGVAWLGIDAKPRTLTVGIDTPAKILPRQHVTVPVWVHGLTHAGKLFVTLAAVDEGILQLTRYPTPDPAGYFFGKRRLGMELRDDYGRLLDGGAEAGAIHEGGDEGIGGPGLPVTSTRTVALYSGPVAADDQGHAAIEIDVPDFEGQLRLMAVAYDHAALGVGEKPLVVRDPVVAELYPPRFLAPDDTAQVALSLQNTDGLSGTYHLALATTGPIQFDTAARDYVLTAGVRHPDHFTLKASDAGIGGIALDLTGPGGLHIHRDWQIAVRGAHYPLTLQQTSLQAPGERFTVDAGLLAPFVPGSVKANISYSASAGIDVPGLLQSLDRYPYGCTEQLSSTAFPLLYLGDPALLEAGTRSEDVKARVQTAIDSILDRQDPQGRFGLWRVGDGEDSPWLNVYALDFLAHASAAGYTVYPGALERGYGWLRETLRTLDRETNGGYYAQAPDATRAYAEYVLSKAGHGDLGALRRAHDMVVAANLDGKLAPNSVYWRSQQNADNLAEPLALAQLGGALALMGDRARAEDSFRLAIANLGSVGYPAWWFDWAYYSEIRDLAGLIAIAAESGEKDIASTLIERLRAKAIPIDALNTQDKAWLLEAAHALNKGAGEAKLSVNGQSLAHPGLPLALTPGLGEIRAGYSVANDGKDKIWRSFTLYGTPRVAPPALADGFTLTKSYFSLTGDKIDPSKLHQNDRVIVLLKGASDGTAAHRAVLADLLPAGWEIESQVSYTRPPTDAGAPIRRQLSFGVPPDSKERTDLPLYGFLGPLSHTRIAEARDDRYVAAFDLGHDLRNWRDFREVNDEVAHLEENEFAVAYIARVVTAGSFTLPEAVVSDMYRPAIMARTAAGTTAADSRE